MKASEFLEEVLKYDNCPENFKSIYAEFQTYQLAVLETLKEFHRVCEKNHIDYQLSYGSLLGLIRDGGQIPWDYDVDVIVAYEDKDSLVKALNNDLKNDYYYYSPENNPKCRHMIMRLAPISFRTEALHVDVFFLTGAPDNTEERRAFVHRIKQLSEIRYGKYVNLFEESIGSPRRFLSLLIRRKMPALCYSIKKLDREYKDLCSKYKVRESEICVSADAYADWREYPSKILWETKVISTSFGEIRIPVHYDELLKLMYGEYMSIPMLDDRIREVMYNYNRIQYYSRKSVRR